RAEAGGGGVGAKRGVGGGPARGGDGGGLLRVPPPGRLRQAAHGPTPGRGPDAGDPAGRDRDRAGADADRDLRVLGQPPLRQRAPLDPGAEGTTVTTTLGSPSVTAILFFVLFVVVTLVITYWAAKRTRTPSEFFAAGGTVSARQNGLALAGDYMSAASFLGIAGLVALSGFDGLIYSVGWLVGWPVVTFLIAEPLRNLGKYTFARIVAYPLEH